MKQVYNLSGYFLDRDIEVETITPGGMSIYGEIYFVKTVAVGDSAALAIDMAAYYGLEIPVRVKLLADGRIKVNIPYPEPVVPSTDEIVRNYASGLAGKYVAIFGIDEEMAPSCARITSAEATGVLIAGSIEFTDRVLRSFVGSLYILNPTLRIVTVGKNAVVGNPISYRVNIGETLADLIHLGAANRRHGLTGEHVLLVAAPLNGYESEIVQLLDYRDVGIHVVATCYGDAYPHFPATLKEMSYGRAQIVSGADSIIFAPTVLHKLTE